MLLISLIIWTLLFFSFVFCLTSICTIIFSFIQGYLYKKHNYMIVTFYNLLILVPSHLFYGGQITYTLKLTYMTGHFDINFYLGFLLYFLLYFSYKIHNFIINKLEKGVK